MLALIFLINTSLLLLRLLVALSIIIKNAKVFSASGMAFGGPCIGVKGVLWPLIQLSWGGEWPSSPSLDELSGD